MNPIELGDGIADTNTVPGVKHRSFFAVLASGARVVMDAPNRTIIIDKTTKTGALSAVVGDETAALSLTGAAGKTAVISANPNDAVLALTGGVTGPAGSPARSISLDTAAAHAVGIDGDRARPIAVVEIRDCEPTDVPGQTWYRLGALSARYRKT